MNQSVTYENITQSSKAPTSNETFYGDMTDFNFLQDAVKMSKYFYGANFVIGLFGNIIAFVVLSRKSYRHSTAAINLRFLACFDLLVLVVAVSYILLLSSYQNNDGFCLFLDFMYNVCNDMSNWTLVSFTVQRVIAVLIPHRAKMILTKNRIYFVIIGITVFMAIADAQDIYFYNDIVITGCFITYPNYLYNVKLALDWFNITKLFIIPFLFIFFGNTILIYSMHRRTKREENVIRAGRNDSGPQSKTTTTSSSMTVPEKQLVDNEKDTPKSSETAKTEASWTIQESGKNEEKETKTNSTTKATAIRNRAKQDRSVTVILIVLNVCFLISKLPHEIQYIYYGVPPPAPTYRELGEKYIVGVVSLINNSCNLFLYVLFGSKFREELKELFKGILKFLMSRKTE